LQETHEKAPESTDLLMAPTDRKIDLVIFII